MQPGPRQDDGSWKSDAFLNVYIPTKDGSRAKVGAIGLKLSKPIEKQLIEYITTNPDENLQKLVSKLEFDFNTTEASNSREVDFG